MLTNRETNRKYRHIIHSPFQVEHRGILVKCDEHGKITMTQNHDDDTFDEINCSASIFIKVSNILAATRKVVWRDKSFTESEEEQTKYEGLPVVDEEDDE